MRIKCEFCGGFIDDTNEICPHCGAANKNLKRQGNGVPRTIEELQSWYVEHNLPPKEVTRFFIGEDYKGPKAFGIYRDESTGNVVVYKNKADGSRAVRYEGQDEAYGVNELYMKLKEIIQQQKAKNVRNRTGYSNKKSGKFANGINITVCTVVVLIFVISIWAAITSPSNGYYNYGGKQYYYLGSSWYEYDSSYGDWYSTSVDEELEENHSDYYQSESYDSSYNSSDFSDTSYYEDWSSSSDSWDSDSSWSSSDSWGDSGGWDSDW